MIISQAPVRISLGGGGTDLPSYYEKFEGCLVAATIDKYVTVRLKRRTDPVIKIIYGDVCETVADISDVKHPFVREALHLLPVDGGLEIESQSDVPEKCGLGTSGAFTVALLAALHTCRGDSFTQQQLAEQACCLEIDRLGLAVGKQDQYMAAFGGLLWLKFKRAGEVSIEKISLSEKQYSSFHQNTHLYYTNIQRRADDILRDQAMSVQEGQQSKLDALHQIKAIGMKTKTVFESDELSPWGSLLEDHWQLKQSLSDKIADEFIARCYAAARQAGAAGGKIMGAGGGGFFLFYCPGDAKGLDQVMAQMGLSKLSFKIVDEGVKVRQSKE